MRHRIVSFLSILALGTPCGVASAEQDPKLIAPTAPTGAAREQEASSFLAERVPAPSEALELKVGSGYTQGFGSIAPGRGLPSVAGAGIGVSADVDYRLTHQWSVGLEMQYQELASSENVSARGLAANLGGTFHFEPVLRGDPWMRLGSGYRALWENNPTGEPGTRVLRHGFEALTAKLGYDVRVSESVALAPVIGADLNVFVWEDATNVGTHALATAQVGTFIYAGLQGRFDLGGLRGDESMPAPPAVGATEMQAPMPAPAPPPPVEEPKQVAPSISVSDEIMAACKQDLGAIDKAPKFDFDHADLLPSDLTILRMVGECFSTGPMKGMPLVLVGRADPRGTVEYNDTLGAKRARNVAEYLESVGVDAGKIEQTSRGKLDAKGTDEASWALDRRVDILPGSR